LIKVANIIEEGKLGGPQKRIASVAHSLAARVKTTVILPTENSENFIKELTALNIPYKLLNLTKVTKQPGPAIRYVLFSLFEIAKLVNYLKSKKFNLIHVSGGSWQYKGVIAGYIAGIKVVWHLNDTNIPFIFRKLFIFFSRFADGFIYASRRSEDYYRTLIKIRKNKPSFIIQAPVNTSLFNPKQNYSGDQELINQWCNKLVIGTIANINRIKGLDTLVECISKLNKIHNDLVFAVIGQLYNNQKHYFNYINQIIKKNQINNIIFVGQRMDVRPLLNRFDIYVCSSKFESSPISVWEAMSMAKPIVSSDVGDVSRYIKTGYNGFIVETNNPDQLAKSISKLIENNKSRIQFGQQSRRIAINNLDISNCVGKHIKAYDKILFNN
jgi:glycosyltransferase involved in cell wall biosynthesis